MSKIIFGTSQSLEPKHKPFYQLEAFEAIKT